MARGGRGDRILPSGRVRTAAGGTRNRGGGLAVVGERAPTVRPDTRTDFRTFRTFSRSGRLRGQGVFRDGVSRVRRTITAGGGATRAALPPAGGTGRGASAPGGTGGFGRVANDPYRRSSAPVTGSQGSGSPGAAPRTPTNAGGRVSDRRAAAIRNAAQRGATPGERAAARAAAQRLGI
jgi:hypothetical protein